MSRRVFKEPGDRGGGLMMINIHTGLFTFSLDHRTYKEVEGVLEEVATNDIFLSCVVCRRTLRVHHLLGHLEKFKNISCVGKCNHCGIMVDEGNREAHMIEHYTDGQKFDGLLNGERSSKLLNKSFEDNHAMYLTRGYTSCLKCKQTFTGGGFRNHIENQQKQNYSCLRVCYYCKHKAPTDADARQHASLCQKKPEPSKDHQKQSKDAVKSGIIYLVQTSQSIRCSDDVYKIGYTKRSMKERLSTYPKLSKVIVQYQSRDCVAAETALKNIFNDRFVQRKEDYGTEYFYGNKAEMVSIIEQFIKLFG